MYRHLCLALLMTLGILLGGHPGAQAAASFAFTPIDVPGASSTTAFGINSSGQIVGYYEAFSPDTLGFLYDGGMVTTIDPPGSLNTIAYGINSSGQIVGSYEVLSPGLQAHGFLYAGGVFTLIDVPGASYTVTTGINPAGQIVGTYGDDTGMPHSFLATPKRK